MTDATTDSSFAGNGKIAFEPNVSLTKPRISSKKSTGIVYRSKSMHELVRNATSYAQSTGTVLITGENGTGKELFAKLIHQNSNRSAKRFCRVNCAAISEALCESEFFGHERGAFTGASQTRIGRFEWASGGTLMLDEVSEVQTTTQAKLLRVLEENEFQRVGSNETIKTDVRLIATSNRELSQQVAAGNFRQDLYYRLNVLRIQIPALRQRTEDIPVLANLFLQKFKHESKSSVIGFDRSAMAELCRYSWPGNIRQLRNVVLSACIVADANMIKVSDLPELEQLNFNQSLPDWLLNSSMEEIERRVIIETLNRSNGNKSAVARILGVTTRTLSNKIKLYRESGLMTVQLT